MRPAQNLKAASYVCPICDGMPHATSEHALIAPKRGELVTEDEWRSGTRRRR